MSAKTISHWMAFSLIWVYHRERIKRAQKNPPITSWVLPANAPDECMGFDRLVWWGLLRSNKHGEYQLTALGRRFVLGKVKVQRFATEDGPEGNEMISIHDALGPRYSLDDLIGE